MYVQSPAAVCRGRPRCLPACSLSRPGDCASGHSVLATPARVAHTHAHVEGGREGRGKGSVRENTYLDSLLHVHVHVAS